MKIKYSTDGGKTYLEAPEGIRIVYERVDIPGEDGRGELQVNLSHENIVTDVWTTREEPLDHNIGTSVEPISDLVARLVEAND